MPDLSQTQPSAFVCEGGLIKSRSTFIMQAGQAIELLNFEPDIEGGYRRINGFRKHINHIVPQTSTSSEKVLMVAFFNNNIVAARGEKIFSSASTELASAITSSATMSGSGTITVDSTTGFSSSGTLQIDSEIFTYTGVTSTTFTGVTRAQSSTTAAAHIVNSAVSESWTQRDTGRTNASKYAFERFNFDGNDKIIVTDGTNDPTVFNTSFSATDVTESSVEGAKFVTAFREHMFYAGMSSTPQTLVFSQPFDEDAFNSGSGAGSIKIDDTIVGMKAFRNDLFIFCENRIFKLTGSSSSDFAITPVTRNIGCINGDTIQEFAGDLIFLGPDGLRTVAGTARIGDVELGTISANVQSIFDENLVDAALFESIVIPDKTQYRIFFAKDGTSEDNTRGVICVMKGQTFEFAELKGIKPSATDTFVEAGNVLVLHGGYDGYIYRQEKGNDFDGTKVSGRYRSPDLTFGDPGIRKHMQRVIVNYKPESAINADMFVRYDYEDRNSARPAAYPLDSEDVVAIYGTSTYGTPTYGGASQPLLRQSVEGSGFAVALRVNDNATTAPYSLKGFQLEYQLGARR
tara:strand:- start:12306 stop:14027 length:1722 start_codon:yes stop_codon:yes gene_type:complete